MAKVMGHKDVEKGAPACRWKTSVASIANFRHCLPAALPKTHTYMLGRRGLKEGVQGNKRT